jgi:predicted choloylglycine hydrolase
MINSLIINLMVRQMKIHTAIHILLLAPILLLSTSIASDIGGDVSNESLVLATENPVVLKNEVLLNKDSTNYTELRHIVLKGTNEEIGKAIGEISQKYYNAKPSKFADPIYAKARLDYFKKNYPAYYERMKGVAEAYHVPLESTDLDLSILPYDAGSMGCSVVFFPPTATSNGHAMTSRNLDYRVVPMDVLLGKVASSNETGLFSRAYVLELYPSEGYSSLVIGGHDLMEVFFQGFNSQGLAIEMLADESPHIVMTPLSGGPRASGISYMLAMRMVLDTCKSVEDAKLVLLNNRIYFPFMGCHFLIYDKLGRSTIAEFISKDDSVHFTDGFGSIRVMTNHPVCLYPTEDKFPQTDANTSYYDSFVRYKTLTNITENHKGKFTKQDLEEILRPVYAEVYYGSLSAGESSNVKIPERTVMNSVLDLTTGTISARFYLRDGPTDSMLGGPTNIFSKFFDFTLSKNRHIGA